MRRAGERGAHARAPIQPYYILAPRGIDIGDRVQSGDAVDIKVCAREHVHRARDLVAAGTCLLTHPGVRIRVGLGWRGHGQLGNALPLRNIPVGTLVHNVELMPGKGGKIARSAGTSAQVIKTGATGYATLRLASNEVRMVPVAARATIGTVSNSLHKNVIHGKAGISRLRGRRPSVRGVAMNPVDHPHGGGQGKTSGGRPSSSPWGVYTKGVRTRNNRAGDKLRVQRRKTP